MKKIQIISDKNKKSLKIKGLLLEKIKSNQFYKKNLIIVIGGDGFMLQTLKKNRNSKKSFYGINSGNYGFLMNKYSSNNLVKNLSKAKMISISPLEMTVSNKNNQVVLNYKRAFSGIDVKMSTNYNMLSHIPKYGATINVVSKF